MKTRIVFLIACISSWLIALPAYSVTQSAESHDGRNAPITHSPIAFVPESHIDSVVIRNEHDTTRVTFAFNNNGTLSLKTEHKYIGTAWVNYAKSLYTYYSDGKLNTITDLRWVNSNWENVQQSLYFYDGNDNNTAILKQDWINNAWVNFEVREFTYDTLNGELSSVLTKNWDSTTWINVYLTNYDYDANGNVTVESLLNYNNNVWENAVNIINTFDTYNHILTMKHLFWIDGAWTNATFFNYTWNVDGNCEMWLRQIWDGTGWLNANLSTFIYDQSGNCTERLYQSWFNNNWENSSKCAYTYMSGHIRGLAYAWDGNWSPWAYNLEIAHYQNGGQQSLFSDWGIQIDYYCHNITTGLASLETVTNGELSIYPNPASDIITVEYMPTEAEHITIKIYSVTGKLMKCLTRENTNSNYQKFQLPVADLPCGLYLIDMTNPTNRYCRKINIVR